jgi:hypothetical protein
MQGVGVQKLWSFYLSILRVKFLVTKLLEKKKKVKYLALITLVIIYGAIQGQMASLFHNSCPFHLLCFFLAPNIIKSCLTMKSRISKL